MKKKVLIVTNFTRLPWENSNARFTYICDLIDKEKYDVELIASSFAHVEKKQREKIKEEQVKDLDYKITLIDEPGYPKNVCIKRILSHKKFGENVRKYILNSEVKPDVIYCAVPSLGVSNECAKLAKEFGAKFIIDIQDLWPEAFKMVFKIPVVKDILFLPLELKANKVYSSADGIVAVSDTYVERAAKVNEKYKQKAAVFLGTDLESFDEAKAKNEVKYDDDLIRIAYIGMLGSSYDINTVIDAIKILNDKGINNLLFVVMGDGPRLEEFKKYAEDKKVKCEFTGRLPYDEMVGKLCSCDIAVNPIVKDAAQSIINKVGDYAAAGLPVLNTQESMEYRNLIDDYKAGLNVLNNNAQDLSSKIEKLYNDKNLIKELGANNRKLAEDKFDRKKTYIKIKEIIES